MTSENMDIEMFGRFSNAFGPSGFEEEVVRVIAEYCQKYELSTDAMCNLYVNMQTCPTQKPVIQLDAHTDECGFMVQTIHDNGCLGILMLGGIVLSNLPAHSVIIRTRKGKKVRGIITSKPIHFMNEKERASQELNIESLYVDIGATSRQEAEEIFGVSVGDPIIPDVTFSYDEEQGICFGKAFDNRAGCACIVDTMEQLYDERNQLAVHVTGAFASQEEVGMRGASVTAQIIKPDLAIVFEGSPSDDFFFRVTQTQGKMKGGVQIRRMDNSYISNPRFIEFAEKLADRYGIRYQEAVRRGGSTNAGKISLTGKAVPVLVLGVLCRYVHSHYNFCAREDLEAASRLAAEVIRGLDRDVINHICGHNILKHDF